MTTNEHHSHYLAHPSEEALNGLLGAVRAQALRQARASNNPEAEDIAQDAALSVHLNIDLYQPLRSSFSKWVWTVTDGVIKDRRQKERRRPALVAADPAPEQVFHPIGTDPVLRMILEGYSQAQCGRELNKSRKAIRVHIVKRKKQGPTPLPDVE